MKSPLWIPCSFFLLLPAALFARAKTDVLVMKNGDHMTCEVKGLDAGVLYVSLDYIDGTASVDWTKVARLESNQLFVVKTVGGDVYTGKLRTPESEGDRPVKIEVMEVAENKSAVVERSQVVRLVETSDKVWQRFSGDASFGVIYTKGNQSTQYSFSSGTAYLRERWNAGATFDSNLSHNAGVSSSTRNSLTLTAAHLLPSQNWFYKGLGGVLQSSETQIARQSTIGAGIGRYLTNTDRATVQLVGGFAWQGTTYQSSVPQSNNQNLAAALIYADARFFKFSKTSFAGTGALLPALSQPGRLRLQINASYYIKIIGNLKWNVSFYGNWDNQPPPTLPGSDYGSSSGLTWTFGLK